MTVIGYARVSSIYQNLDIQEAALKAAGADVIRSEKRSGTSTALASGEDRGGVARVPSSRLTVSDVELAPIPGQELV